MSAFGQTFVDRLARESWALYGLGVAIVGIRTYARLRKLGGIRGLDVDDYLIFVALAFYTVLIVALNLTAQGAGSALALPGEDVFSFPESEVKARAKGAKIDLVAEQGMLNTIWILKACMLLLYNRLTLGVKNNIAVKVLAVYSAVGYIACQIAFFTECRPFSSYWQIAPSPDLNCMVLWTYAAVQCTFNISSDIAMLLIPLPMVLGVRVPLRQKLVLLAIFGMGFFVIAAAVCTKVEFWISIYSADYMFWYTREASVALYVANLPCVWPLVREIVPALRSWSPGSYSKTRGTGPSALTGANKSGFGTALRSMRGAGTVNEIGLEDVEAGNDRIGFKEPAVSVALRQSMDSDERDLLGFGGVKGGIRAETTIEMTSAPREEAELEEQRSKA